MDLMQLLVVCPLVFLGGLVDAIAGASPPFGSPQAAVHLTDIPLYGKRQSVSFKAI